MNQPTCPRHPAVTLRCPACDGAKGGARKTEAQVTAVTANLERTPNVKAKRAKEARPP